MQIETEIAHEKLGWALRELTANLLRVTRGAGFSASIAFQMQTVVEAFVECRDADGYLPSSYELDRLLNDAAFPAPAERISDNNRERHDDEETILRGALRVIAGRLLDQRLQEIAGRSDMSKGIDNLLQRRA